MRSVLLCVCLGSLVVSACSSFSSSSVETAPTPDGDGGTGDGGVPIVLPGQPARGITVSVGDPRVTSYITQGALLALPLTLTRQTASQGPIDVTVKGLPVGVTADALTVPAGALTGTLTLHALATSVPGSSATIDVEAVEQNRGAGASVKLTAFVRGTSGSIDTTFAAAGTLIGLYPSGHVPYDTQVLRDGSALLSAKVASNDLISRITPAGALDPAFGVRGTAIVTSAGVGHGLRMSAVEGATPSDGFIYALEVDLFTHTLFRLHADGSPDMEFATAGRLVIEDGGTTQELTDAYVRALPDGSALVSAEGGMLAGITRWKADGTRDLTYGTSGVCAGAGRMLRKSTGIIVSLGKGGAPTLRGCDQAGLPEKAIGTAPDYALTLDAPTFVDATLTDNDSVLQLGGYSGSWWSRLSPSYVTDATIGQSGMVSIPTTVNVVLSEPGGGVLTAGETGDVDNPNLTVYASTVDGHVNKGFGTAGSFSLPFDQFHFVVGLVGAPDGRAIVVGRQGIDGDSVYVRFWQ